MDKVVTAPTDFAALLAAVDAAYVKMTPGAVALYTDGAEQAKIVHQKSGDILAAVADADTAGGIVALVNAYPRLREEIARLHRLVCDARIYVDSKQHVEWEREAYAEADRCEQEFAKIEAERDQLRAHLAQVTTALRALVDECSKTVGEVRWPPGVAVVAQARRVLPDLPDAPGEK